MNYYFQDRDGGSFSQMINKNKINRFLIISAVIVVAACVAAFGALIRSNNSKNTEMIGSVGTIYMEGMNERISAHFDTIFSLRLSAAEGVVSLDPPEQFADPEEAVSNLTYSAKASDFTFCAFACDTELVPLYGEEVSLVLPEKFRNTVVEGGKSLVTTGRYENGNYIVLIAVPAKYEMPDKRRSDALVMGVSVDLLNQALSLEHTADSLVYSQLIRSDGSFVLSDDETYTNYFDRFLDKALEYNGKKPEDYISEMKNAIASNTSFSVPYRTAKNTGHMYFMPLPNTEWYLITFMPYGRIDETVSEINSRWVRDVVISCGAVLFVLLIIFIYYSAMNRSQMRELDAARSEALRATKAKSEFLSNMSHDIRTPMNAIVGMTAIAEANIDDKQQIKNCLNKISLSGKHLLGLINDILDMSKIESGKMTLNMEQVSLREVMDSIVSIIRPQMKAKNQHFEVSISNIICEDVYSDGVRLDQVLINLLSNAVKFTPENGNIKLSLREEESPLGETHVRVFINVKDNGIGMSPEFKKQVFETFMREDSLRVHKTEGTGLGMAITKYIVEAMGGTIVCESEQGKGTEFIVTVDMERSLVKEEDMTLPAADMLVVDDDAQICESTAASLKDIGINAEWTLDGETAVKMVTKRHEENNDFRIVLIDWKLPGIDGIETAKRIRKNVGDDVTILLISAYDRSDIENEAKEAGINGFISKPLFRSTLYYGLKSFMLPEGSDGNTTDEKTDLSGHRILIAEDNDLNWEIADTLLEQLGPEIERAENGKTCVDMFKASEAGYYDAILMDIRMPVMTGYEAAEAIRDTDRSDSDIPIIAMTADAFAEDVKRCLDAGMNAHVAKPIDVNEVAKVLEKYIKE